jgi:hypothetical protein
MANPRTSTGDSTECEHALMLCGARCAQDDVLSVSRSEDGSARASCGCDRCGGMALAFAAISGGSHGDRPPTRHRGVLAGHRGRKDRIIARLAIVRFLSPYLAGDEDENVTMAAPVAGAGEESAGLLPTPEVPLSVVLPRSADGVLKLSRFIISATFPALAATSVRASIADAERLVTALGESSAEVKGIDLTGAALVDDDLRHVTSLVRRLPHCSLVKLANNSFKGGDRAFWENLRELLRIEHVQAVDLSYCTAMHGAHAPEITGLTDDASFLKLMWLHPPYVIDTGRWMTWLTPRSADVTVGAVQRRHKHYIDLLKRHKSGGLVLWQTEPQAVEGTSPSSESGGVDVTADAAAGAGGART